MFKFAVIENNIVTNCIVADTREIAEEATKCLCIESATVKIGDTWDGENFISNPIVIEEV